MTAVYTIAGVALIVAGLVGYWRRQDPARRAERRARARRGYVRIRP
jgi:hypothetical protein